MAETTAPDTAHDRLHLDLPDEPISYEAFLEWADEDVNAEWVDGHIILMSPISDPHQNIVEFFLMLIRHLVESREEGWVRSSKFQMKLDVRPSGREPDVIYLREEHMDRMKGTYVDGPGDLVVEVISEESGPRDRGDKFYEYEAAGVPEYWLVDPLREEVTVYRLREERYRTVFEGSEGPVESEILEGFRIRAEWLWQENMPPVLDVLRTWGVV